MTKLIPIYRSGWFLSVRICAFPTGDPDMFLQHTRAFRLFSLLLLAASQLSQSALGKNAVEAAQDLANVNQSDPNGFALMISSICMLFVFAISLIVATSIHVFKKKPARPVARTISPVAREEASLRS